MPIEIRGELPKPLDGAVRKILERTLGPRPQDFVVDISRPYREVIVHIQQPFDKRLKFNCATGAEVARELDLTVSAITDEELGPTGTS